MRVIRCPIAMLVFAIMSGCSQQVPSQDVGPTSVSANTCPGRDFSSFLRAFAADEGVRTRFTAPFVRVADWRDISDFNKGVSTTAVAKSDYRDFTLRFSSGAFHHASSDGTIDPTPLDVHVEAMRTGYRVGYVYGMSEGNSWVFERTGQCWLLTTDPEPPAE